MTALRRALVIVAVVFLIACLALVAAMVFDWFFFGGDELFTEKRLTPLPLARPADRDASLGKPGTRLELVTPSLPWRCSTN